jgi:hypothetical protein
MPAAPGGLPIHVLPHSPHMLAEVDEAPVGMKSRVRRRNRDLETAHVAKLSLDVETFSCRKWAVTLLAARCSRTSLRQFPTVLVTAETGASTANGDGTETSDRVTRAPVFVRASSAKTLFCRCSRVYRSAMLPVSGNDLDGMSLNGRFHQFLHARLERRSSSSSQWKS